MSKKNRKNEAKQAEVAEAAQAEAQVAEVVETPAEGAETPKLTVAQKMTKQLRAARPRYVPCTTSRGNKSLRCKDATAELLEGLSVEEVYSVVEGKLGLAAGTLAAKYASLNPGQKRMNAGNLLRNAAKRGEVQV